jgi:hypothetical protein
MEEGKDSNLLSITDSVAKLTQPPSDSGRDFRKLLFVGQIVHSSLAQQPEHKSLLSIKIVAVMDLKRQKWRNYGL